MSTSNGYPWVLHDNLYVAYHVTNGPKDYTYSRYLRPFVIIPLSNVGISKTETGFSITPR